MLELQPYASPRIDTWFTPLQVILWSTQKNKATVKHWRINILKQVIPIRKHRNSKYAAKKLDSPFLADISTSYLYFASKYWVRQRFTGMENTVWHLFLMFENFAEKVSSKARPRTSGWQIQALRRLKQGKHSSAGQHAASKFIWCIKQIKSNMLR